MRRLLPLLLASLLSACALPPLPERRPDMAWVDLFTRTGKLVMAESLDRERLNDGRYFQVTPGEHELIIRFDYEISYGLNWTDPQNRTCYLRVPYKDFKAGAHYRLEGRVLGIEPEARLYDSNDQIVATDNRESCIF